MINLFLRVSLRMWRRSLPLKIEEIKSAIGGRRKYVRCSHLWRTFFWLIVNRLLTNWDHLRVPLPSSLHACEWSGQSFPMKQYRGLLFIFLSSLEVWRCYPMEWSKDPGVILVWSVGPHLGFELWLGNRAKGEDGGIQLWHTNSPFCGFGVQADDSEPLSIHFKPQSILNCYRIASIQLNSQNDYKTAFWCCEPACLVLPCLVHVIFGLLLFWFVRFYFTFEIVHRKKAICCIDDDAGRNAAAPKNRISKSKLKWNYYYSEEKRVVISLTYHHAKRTHRAIVDFAGVGVVVVAAVVFGAPALVGNRCAWLTDVKPQAHTQTHEHLKNV